MHADSTVQITLQPQGRVLSVPYGAPLQQALFSSGVEFPCGGKGLCRGCRIRTLSGNLDITPIQTERPSNEELAQGWRLACQCRAETDLVIEVAQWDMAVLSDDQPFTFTPRPGYGVAVDLGTTTIAAQLIDLRQGCVVSVYSCLNPQAEFGGDLISRIQYVLQDSGAQTLTTRIRDCIQAAAQTLLQDANVPPKELQQVILSGNTVMHHIFCGFDVTSLSQAPFQSPHNSAVQFTPDDLQWNEMPNATVTFLPALGSFVGSDLLAGILATGLHQSERPCALIDLGTNGEIIVGNREKIVCTSTAVGPAFEGGRIHFGMRATTGAISQVTAEDGQLRCSVIGSVKAKGICGSGLVEAAAAALDLNWINPSGRITLADKKIPLTNLVHLTQQDIRQLQLAKAAITAGFEILIEEWGATVDDLEHVYLAGAFGNYVNLHAAEKIGLLPLPAHCLTPVGNSSLRGTKCALCQPQENSRWYEPILQITKHLTLSEHPKFQDLYITAMTFPQ
ncbi:MAG: ASKHA domain-containing protein [Candidatus Hinthialibacter antarcticus]|nr:ASKHA domain-containing protein [Candidatus Hinthialibacter antarcticus]